MGLVGYPRRGDARASPSRAGCAAPPTARHRRRCPLRASKDSDDQVPDATAEVLLADRQQRTVAVRARVVGWRARHFRIEFREHAWPRAIVFSRSMPGWVRSLVRQAGPKRQTRRKLDRASDAARRCTNGHYTLRCAVLCGVVSAIERWVPPLLTGNRSRRGRRLRRIRTDGSARHTFEMTFSAYFSRLRILFSRGSVSGPTM